MKDLLEDAQFQKILTEIAYKQKQSQAKIKKEAESYLEELYTNHKPLANMFAVQGGQYILSRAYDRAIDINPQEIKELAKLMRRHPVAFVMTHKTYIDMLVLGIVLARHGLPLPYTFGGINLNFLGLGQFGRRNGVIFIRRSFKDNPVYKATLRHYISSLVNDKAHFMWAIEGTRSRTGKLVWPKMGILKYIMEAEQDSRKAVKYVPVSIVYDLIPDVKEMTKEGRGKDKKPESLTWLINYLRKMGDNLGRISVRLGAPVDREEFPDTVLAFEEVSDKAYKGSIPRFALELVHRINQITPVTTASLICISLLSKYALSKRAIESDVADLMQLIENQKPDALVNRGKAIGESVQFALNLLTKAELIRKMGDGLKTKFAIVPENYLPTTYYANMAVHHLYHRAFIELAFLKVNDRSVKERALAFWSYVMNMRDLFKFEFFYSRKPQFSDEIEINLRLIDPDWSAKLHNPKANLESLLKTQKVLVAPVVLHPYIEAYRVVAYGLQTLEPGEVFEEDAFIERCLLLGGEMQWQRRIQRIESVSKPFLINGIRLAKNRNLIPTAQDDKKEALKEFLTQLDKVADLINTLQGISLTQATELLPSVPLERDIVPGSKTDAITREVLEGEAGPHIGAFFDLDRTLIKGFSAKEFFQRRLLSGQITTKELVAQFAGVLVYTIGNGNFAGLATKQTALEKLFGRKALD
ncbi:MAG: 1-acyl-sn-glycerol-3-phosphate acyltransferase [Bacteroidota bacterium]